jgi:hypothetical protein
MVFRTNWRVAAVEVIVWSPGLTLMLRPRAEIRAQVMAALVAAGSLVSGCDGGAHTPDAQTTLSAASAELSVRFDISGDKAPTVSVLGFRAATAGPYGEDVLGLVDPLSAAAPDQGCVLRDVDEATSALVARGSSIDLEELSGVGVGFGPNDPELPLVRPFPRVFPDVAGVVGGVVAEAGPQPLSAMPEHVSLYSADSELAIAELGVPALPRLFSVNGIAPTAGARVETTSGVALSLGAAAGAIIELRPFGATVAVTCTVPTNASTEAILVIPHALLVHLFANRSNASSGVAASIEIARRMQIREPLTAGGARVSIEVRSALPLELRP